MPNLLRKEFSRPFKAIEVIPQSVKRHSVIDTIPPRHFVQTTARNGIPATVVEEICGEIVVSADYGTASSLLLRVQKWSALKAWGMAIQCRSGLRRAIVAVARKLA